MRPLSWRPLDFASLSSRAALLALLLGATVICWIGWQFDPRIADEDHQIEWLQAGLLALAGLVHLRRALSLERGKLGFMIHCGLALLMYSFLMRELDIREWDDPGQSGWAWTEHILRSIGWALWLRLAIYIVPRRRHFFANFWALWGLPVTVLAICGGLFLCAGWPFDKNIFHSVSEASATFVEEVLELNGYLLLMAAALARSELTRD